MKNTMRRHAPGSAIAFALAFTLAPVYAQQPLNPPLKNWAAPLYWAPTPAEAERLRLDHGAPSLAQAASIFSAPGPMTFIAMTPCRVMDTRGAPYTPAAAFGPPTYPSLAPGVGLSVPMPSSSNCSIPSNAGAYSLNITAISDGGGLLSSLSVWPVGDPYPGVSTLNDSVAGGVIANAAVVVAGTSGAIQMVAFSSAGTTTDVIVDINGYYAAPTDGSSNTGIGYGALASNTIGNNNTASGLFALGSNITGAGNTASGAYALESNTGDYNTAFGISALLSNTSGSGNTASGAYALDANTIGVNNTASGIHALFANTTGDNNTASGDSALSNNTTGSNNIAIGSGAANNVSGGNSNNIHIGNQGTSGDGSAANNSVIRIGTDGIHASTYMAGISGVSVTGGVAVYVAGNGRLGTVLSSRRFKEQITDMGDSSSKLFQLRPVTFFYKPEYDDGAHLLQYGLIAEDVEKVFPEMVAYDKDGRITTVKYQLLAPMLLNEARKQNAQLQSQAEQNQKLEEQNRKLEDRLAALEALLSGHQ